MPAIIVENILWSTPCRSAACPTWIVFTRFVSVDDIFLLPVFFWKVVEGA